MSLLLGALTLGLILSLLALGVFISYRIFSYADLTAEGSVTLGAAVAAALLVQGTDPVTATLLAMLAGAAAGALTGLLHTKLRINGLLAGILVMTSLYSINLHVMGRSNIPLMSSDSFAHWAQRLSARLGEGDMVQLLGREVARQDLVMLGLVLLFVVAVALLLLAFFRTQLGTAMRATGDNPQMIRALGVDDGLMITAGLAVSNALVALAGALLAQYQGFADVQMGIGMLVWGLASVIIGEALVGAGRLGHLIAGAILGSLLFRLLVAVALRWGLDPNDLKLVTAAFVLLALVAPTWLRRLRAQRAGGHAHA